jgi:hypothetical protein
MTLRLHYTAINYLNRLGIPPIVDDNSVSVVLGSRSHTFATGKDLMAHLRALDASGDLAALVSASPDRTAKSGMVYKRYKTAYKATGGNCGDDLANELRHATQVEGDDGRPYTDIKAVRAIARENELTAKGANPGHALMNLSNVLRARARRGEAVQIDGSPFKGSVHKAPNSKKGS